MVQRKLTEGTVWDKANGKVNSELGSWKSKQERKGVTGLEEGYSRSRSIEMEVNWLEWRSCIEMF